MPTDVTNPKSYLTLTDDRKNYILSISTEEISGDIAFYQEQEDINDTTGFHFQINKEDWEEIKKFIDLQFKLYADV